MSIKISDTNNIPKALKGLSSVKGKKLETGVFGDGHMAMIAAAHEFGSPKNNIPERSFLRSAHDEHSSEIVDKFEKLLPDIIEGVDGEAVLEGLGLEFSGRVQAKLREIQSPPLQPETIKRKKSSNPLIDEGNLVGSIEHRVT
ncbi:hypothetical protein M3689_05610 [Alkalihalophilus marmarensis]|uniref:hypothetical protein n=1 Tax=Alkalihalophilus marmarensis TaxID=521377 RepID=UPI00203FA2BE|nr:hypothetical protein [Alkalihalophilus marmarensis]MCM3488783.1 hypothetical protein [Alkalihalophilus marmarensis]